MEDICFIYLGKIYLKILFKKSFCTSNKSFNQAFDMLYSKQRVKYYVAVNIYHLQYLFKGGGEVIRPFFKVVTIFC